MNVGQGAGSIILLVSPVSRMQSFMTTVKSCITNDTNLKAKYGTCGTNLDVSPSISDSFTDSTEESS